MKVKRIFGGKWVCVVDNLVDFDVAHTIPRCYRVAGLRITGNVAPFGGSWETKGDEIVLVEASTFLSHTPMRFEPNRRDHTVDDVIAFNEIVKAIAKKSGKRC